MEEDLEKTMARLRPLLKRSESDPRPVAVMTCGIAGAGKSTLARAILAEFPSFHRLSIDGIIAERHGIYGVDFPADPKVMATYEAEADDIYDSSCQRLLREGQDILLDRSFYAKEDRDQFKQWVEEGGARWVLVYFNAAKDVLWRRICERKAKGKTADSALDIDEALLDKYYTGFDVPRGEGEIVIDVK